MKHALSPAVFFTSTITLLSALTGCAIGTSEPIGAGGSSNDGNHDEDSGSGGQISGGENPSGGNPSEGGGNDTIGNDQGGGSSGDAPSGGSGASGSGSSGAGASGSGGELPDNGNEGAGDPGGNPNEGEGIFLASNAWTKYVGDLPKSSHSNAIVNWLDKAGGWGGGIFRMDFGLTILEADDSTPKKQFNPTNEFYYPDCDEVPFPVPAGGALEAEEGYQCVNDGDCHLIVHHKGENKLYEMWRAHFQGNTFYGGCAAVWDLTKTYPFNLRGEGCTSADAGGFPIAAMLFTPEEVQSGAIQHALRFILPNSRIRDNVYVHPGTHSTNPTSGGPDAPPYGVRLRLRKDFPLSSLPNDASRVIAKAIQEYGMFLADGGNIALTGASDRYSSVKWDDMGIDSYSLDAIEVTDMEVVDMGDPINWSGDCVRN